jgi:hypothetical protein
MAKTVTVQKGLSKRECQAAVIRKTLREQGGDYRGATYDPKTGKGKCT